jgi:ArsR family transcriptional regulator, lead/cadmium/zinc/bismuth-responsive transcriptional repressor
MVQTTVSPSIPAGLSSAEASSLADMFRLLADPTRTRILFALADGEERYVCDLAAAVQMPESSVSHALRLLRIAGVVKNRRDGRHIYYSLDDSHVKMLIEVSREHLAHKAR